MEYKYIIVKGPVPDEELSAIIFPKRVSHREVAKIHRANDESFRLVGAGFCSIGERVTVWGESESLRGMKSKLEDATVIAKDFPPLETE